MTKPPSELADKFMLRMPGGLRDQLKRAAHKNGRSMNAEIVARIVDSFESAPEAELLDYMFSKADRKTSYAMFNALYSFYRADDDQKARFLGRLTKLVDSIDLEELDEPED